MGDVRVDGDDELELELELLSGNVACMLCMSEHRELRREFRPRFVSMVLPSSEILASPHLSDPLKSECAAYSSPWCSWRTATRTCDLRQRARAARSLRPSRNARLRR